MKFTGTIDSSRFQEAMGVVAAGLGLKGDELPNFVRRQAGLLCSTLIRITPPANLAKTRKSIEGRVGLKFMAAGSLSREFTEATDSRHGQGEFRWYAWSPDHLYGVAQDKDMRAASVDELYRLSFTLTRAGRTRLSFKHPRRKQNIILTQRILTESKTVDGVIKRFQSHIGRLKAAWVVSWTRLGRPGSPPPQWVSRHSGERGAYKDELNVQVHPAFSMINRSAGSENKAMLRQLQRALNIRAKAMVEDLKFYIRGMKERAKLAA